jgi:penicillin amidase
VLAGVLAAGTGGLALSSASELLEQFGPLSGSLWDSAGRELPESVESPYGGADLRVDEYGVPHIQADDEEAAYFAVGYVQAFDRLFQMDLQRRVMRGRLSEVVGDVTVEDDEFNIKMDFAGAAEVTWENMGDTDAAPLVEAYADGVNAAMENEELPVEFNLLGYEPSEWTPVDSVLMAKQIAWGLTGNFVELRRALVSDRLGEDAADILFPRRYDHDSPILRDELDAESLQEAGLSDAGGKAPGNGSPTETTAGQESSVGEELTTWLSSYESPPGIGSNSWVVSGEHTESGTPLLAYDPHLQLMTPPVWYEQHIDTPENSVRGATFPGAPFVIVGANENGAWSFTNVGADVLDVYSYETDEEGERYRYEGEWREFETEQREIPVADGDDREVTVRKTVHGPVLEREGREVGVSWTGHTVTRGTVATYEMSRTESLEDAVEATRIFDLPTQNLVYANADGRTMYYATGKLPIRRIDGEVVEGDRVFDGSAGEGEWEGFEPFGESSWEGFVPFEEKPHAIDPDVVGTANQRVLDDPEHYIAAFPYAAPYRGVRIYDRLDERVGSDEPVDADFHRDLQTDTYDGRAEQLVPELTEAVEQADVSGSVEDAVGTLEDWDYRMVRDSRAALVFSVWMNNFVEGTVEPQMSDADLDEEYYPNDWIVASMSPDSLFYEETSREETMVEALEKALDEVDSEGWTTYGDWNTTRGIEHPLGGEAGFLNYDEIPADGSRATVLRYNVEDGNGTSWRMVVEPGNDENTTCVLPGGNSGDYFSENYDDQLRMWTDGEQKPMDKTHEGDTHVVFGEGSS